jgi:outer membrane immunogenic protein
VESAGRSSRPRESDESTSKSAPDELVHSVREVVSEVVMCTRFIAAATVILFCLPGPASAQQADLANRGSVEGGVKGGVTFATIPKFGDALSEATGADTSYRVGATIGGFLAFSFANNFSIQPEVLYTQRGIEGDAPVLGETFKVKLSYIDLPVLLRIGPSNGRGVHVLVGPSFNFNAGAQLIVGGTFNDEQDFKEEIEDVDVGLVVGAGYYGGLLILEGRYEEGLTNVATRPASESYHNRTFIGMIGIRFGRSAAKPAP